jgi:hypothetical protein
MVKTSRDIMLDALIDWAHQLENLPGWTEWQKTRLARTLWFDEPVFFEKNSTSKSFDLPDPINKQHDVIMQYLQLNQTISALRDCEFYFRRYPFRGLPVSKYDHITNTCEMYFNRFYEFKERMRKYFKALDVVAPQHRIDVGKLIKLFDKIFEAELRARHGVHHHARFEDVAIDRLFFAEVVATRREMQSMKLEQSIAYRKFVREWVKRVRLRALKMDEFLEAIAEATMSTCGFLKSVGPVVDSPPTTPPT